MTAAPLPLRILGAATRLTVRLPLINRAAGPFHAALGRLIPSLPIPGVRSQPSYPSARANWDVLLRRVNTPYTLDDSDPLSPVYTFHQCPVGHCRPQHLAACLATMELDSSLVDRSGARLVIDKRIPSHGVCVLRIVPK